jgi:GNAT superfamily N-acetyltransferase
VDLPDGYTGVPAGKIASVVTHLEMCQPPAAATTPLPAGLAIRRATAIPPSEYRALFRAVGEPWLWFSRLCLSDEDLRAVLDDPRVETFVLARGTTASGLLELDCRRDPDVEIGFLGVTPDLVGTGAGRALLGFALERAWSRPTRRVVLHTCTLDHPRALAFYLSAGFRPYRREVEVADDPRLTGVLPRAAAPHVPIIE